MFTGIIENTGIVEEVIIKETNKIFIISTPLVSKLKPSQSLSHNGACLTIEKSKKKTYQVAAIEETLLKTNLNSWKIGSIINLERCLKPSKRLDGHIVQGHVDSIAICSAILSKAGSWEYTFEFDEKFSSLIIEKGSVCLNGISLTIFNVGVNYFSVGIIPYTYLHTNMKTLKVGEAVNIEFDMMGKYINRILQLQKK